MSFFDDLPRPEQPDDDDRPETHMPEWFGPPKDVMGGVVPLNDVVLRTEHVFVGVRSLTAYRTGLLVDLVLAGRRQGLPKERWQVVHDSVLDHLHPLTGGSAEGAVRLGMEMADGRRLRAGALMGLNPFRDSPPPPVLLDRGGSGGGGPRAVDRRTRLWLWPLPSDAAASLVLEWPDLDVPVTHHRLDLEPVRAAVDRVTPYWP